MIISPAFADILALEAEEPLPLPDVLVVIATAMNIDYSTEVFQYK